MTLGTRRLVALLAADIAGYSRLMEATPELTYASLRTLDSEVVEPRIAAHRGRIAKRTGDGFLAWFETVSDGLAAATTLQATISERARANMQDVPLFYRMSLHLAEVFLEPHDIFGDGVNVAVRLQTHAEPGGVVVSAPAHAMLQEAETQGFVDLGELPLKNIGRPMRAFGLGAPGGAPAALAPSLHDGRPSIAVVPFHQFQPESSEDYFAEGVIEGIIHVLAGLREVFVLSQGSTRRYAGVAVDAQQIGAELGVRYVLHGRVRRGGGQLRIVTELLDAQSGAVLRSDLYTGRAEELFALQDRISQAVVQAIAPQVRQEELRRALRKHADVMSAYDLLLRALDQLHRFDQPSFFRAGGLLQQAISVDSGFVPARSYRAWWHILRISQGWSSAPEADTAEAARHSALALSIDATDFLALTIRGHGLDWTRNHRAALDVLDRATELGPNCALAWTMRGLTCGYLGDAAEAIRCGEQALRLTPSDPFAFFHEAMLAQNLYFSGQRNAAIALGRKVLARCPSFTSNLRLLAVALSATGEMTEAGRMLDLLLAAEPNFNLTSFEIRTVLPPTQRAEYIARMRAAGAPA
jgi:TolB-like protein